MTRGSIYVDQDIWKRAKAVTARRGVPSISALVNEYLAGMVPMMEQAVEAADKGDRSAMLQILDAFIVGNLANVGPDLATLRRELTEKSEEEDTG